RDTDGKVYDDYRKKVNQRRYKYQGNDEKAGFYRDKTNRPE
ncbi:unnamed protein product, partial [marine sediment metagenome]